MEIYFDNAAATPIAPQVTAAMTRAARITGNPSSFNDAGRASARALADARNAVATFLNARPDEVVFCASGSEANSLAILGSQTGVMRGAVLTTPIEHLSVLEPVRELERRGMRVAYLPVTAEGLVDAKDVTPRIRPSTKLVSVMYANNEIGSVLPIAKIGRAVAEYRRKHRSRLPLFHVDACQATTTLPMDVRLLGADLLTFNGAKAYGPHGAAVLFVRRGVIVTPQTRGGSQEGTRRAGTEDVASATGMAAALSLVKQSDTARITRLRDHLIAGMLASSRGIRLNGPVGAERLAGNVNISVAGADSENLLLELDRYGIRAGSGSACTAHSVEPSHVLTAIGTPKDYLDGVVRFSLGRTSTKAQVDAVMRVFPGIVERVRNRRLRSRA